MTKNAEFVKNHWYWRPGWQIGSRFYTWHITFADQSEVTTLADGYRSHLKNVPAVDIVPNQWLHLTMQGIGFVDQAPDVDDIVTKARERCALLEPFNLRIGRPHVDPESIQIAVEPAEPVRELRQAIRSAIADVRGADNVPERAEPYNPHMSLGYINSDGPASPFVATLDTVPSQTAEATITSCQLIILNRDAGMYIWEPYATVTLG